MHLFGELNRLVGEYQWHSIVHPSTEGVMEFLRPPFEVTGTKRWEYQAVRWLLDLFERRGELDMVHLCPMHEQRIECKGWFYGRPNKRFDRFCNPLCKQAHYDSTDEIKARRAKNAEHNRAYRSNLKRQEDAAKKKVGFKGAVLHRVSRAALSVKKAKPKASSD
jgi:hypothetical protein